MSWLKKIAQYVDHNAILMQMCNGRMSVEGACAALNSVPNNVVCDSAGALLLSWPNASRELEEVRRRFGCENMQQQSQPQQPPIPSDNIEPPMGEEIV